MTNLLNRPVRRAAAAAVAAAAVVLPPTANAQQLCGDWVQVAPPAGATLAVTDVQAVSTDDAWAFATPLGLVRWDGSTWSQFPIDDLNGSYSVVWISQFGLVNGSLFLAGNGQTSPFSSDLILKIWDGTQWGGNHSLTLEPNIQGAPRNGGAISVVGASENDVWILGEASGTGDGINGQPLLTVHWDGSDLTEVFTPGVGNRQNNLFDAVLFASDDIWTVGEYNNTGTPDGGVFHGMAYHYDGSSWTHVPNPSESIASTHLYAVDGVAPDDVWAAGDSPSGPLFMHWDGGSWTIVPSPATTGTIQKLAAIASDDVWAVDSPWQVPAISKYYHWDGVSWSVVTPPAIPGATSVSRHGGLAAAGECDVWAVGSYDIGNGIDPFIERLQSSGTAPTAVPLVAASGTDLTVSPNPFRLAAEIRLASPGDRIASARVFDVQGRLVRTLSDFPAGADRLRWDGLDSRGASVPAGVYFVRVESLQGRTHQQKVTVLR
jgi:hypothetical protein